MNPLQGVISIVDINNEVVHWVPACGSWGAEFSQMSQAQFFDDRPGDKPLYVIGVATLLKITDGPDNKGKRICYGVQIGKVLTVKSTPVEDFVKDQWTSAVKTWAPGEKILIMETKDAARYLYCMGKTAAPAASLEELSTIWCDRKVSFYASFASENVQPRHILAKESHREYLATLFPAESSETVVGRITF